MRGTLLARGRVDISTITLIRNHHGRKKEKGSKEDDREEDDEEDREAQDCKAQVVLQKKRNIPLIAGYFFLDRRRAK